MQKYEKFVFKNRMGFDSRMLNHKPRRNSMKIIDKFTKCKENGSPLVSFEIFPPKKAEAFENVGEMLSDLCKLKPDFISVTCGAGGGSNRNKTIELASKIKNEYGIESMAHMTCITLNSESILREISAAESAGLQNVLALRGDAPKEDFDPDSIVFHHAYDLIKEIKSNSNLCTAAAAYPEGHIECDSFEKSIEHLKIKEEAGAEFFVSQLFFDNRYFYNLLDSAAKVGIKSPITPGIMPMMSKSQISNMIFMCGASLPSEMIKILYKYENDSKSLLKAAIEYSGRQIADLIKNGAEGIHIYSMNKPAVAAELVKYIGL